MFILEKVASIYAKHWIFSAREVSHLSSLFFVRAFRRETAKTRLALLLFLTMVTTLRPDTNLRPCAFGI